MAEEVIRTAVQQELTKRGLREDTTSPDLLITHDVLVERATSEQRDPVYLQLFTQDLQAYFEDKEWIIES